MATDLQNAQAVLDALADSLGKTLTGTQKTNIVEEFIDKVGGSETNDEKALIFLQHLIEHVKEVSKFNAAMQARTDNKPVLDTAMSDARDNASANALS